MKVDKMERPWGIIKGKQSFSEKVELTGEVEECKAGEATSEPLAPCS